MYERISIQGFRGLKELTIDHLAPISILIGKNGSGKSTVLEALWVHAVPDAPFFGEVDAFRNFEWDLEAPDRSPAPWQHLFYGYELQEPIVISGKANESSWSMKLQQPPEAEGPLWSIVSASSA
jgi:energy-coupling factor transporter ATP-binding protein EcfA2